MLLGPYSSSKINVLVIPTFERGWKIYHIKFRDLLLKIGGVQWSEAWWYSSFKTEVYKESSVSYTNKEKMHWLWTCLDLGLIYNTCGYVTLTCLSSGLLTKLFTNSGARERKGIPADQGCSTGCSPSWLSWSNRFNGACSVFGRLTCCVKQVQA